MTEKDKKEIEKLISDCFEKQNSFVSNRNNVNRLQELFDEIVSLKDWMKQNPKYSIEQYAIIEEFSQHALNMAKLNDYIQKNLEPKEYELNETD